MQPKRQEDSQSTLDAILGKITSTTVDPRMEIRSKSPLRKRSLSRSNLNMPARTIPHDVRIKVHRRKVVSSRGAQIIYKASCKQIKHPIIAKTFQYNDPSL